LQAGHAALADLRRYRQAIPRAEFLSDGDRQRMALHAVLVATQSCIDEALAACRRRGLSTDTYRGAFEALARAGAMPAEWAAELLGWASLRNVVAHFYPVVDMGRVYDSLSEVEVLERFLAWAEKDGT
jgi:uncharacterized protein YutE (UPF0331/DUF86 family)